VLVVRYEDLMGATDLPMRIREFTGVGFESQHTKRIVAKAAALSEPVQAQVMAAMGQSYEALCAHAVPARPLSSAAE